MNCARRSQIWLLLAALLCLGACRIQRGSELTDAHPSAIPTEDHGTSGLSPGQVDATEVPDDFRVIVERFEQNVTRPWAVTTIHANARVLFAGHPPATITGTHEHRVTPQAVRELWILLSALDLPRAQSGDYRQRVWHAQRCVLTITSDQVTVVFNLTLGPDPFVSGLTDSEPNRLRVVLRHAIELVEEKADVRVLMYGHE